MPATVPVAILAMPHCAVRQLIGTVLLVAALRPGS